MAQEHAREIIGIGWLDLGWGQNLYKFSRTPELDLDGNPTDYFQYKIDHVKPETYPAAFKWIVTSFWPDNGVWYAGKPGIVFSPDVIEIFRAVKAIHRPQIGEKLRYPVMMPAPVAFDWTEYHDGENKHGMIRYTYISPKRTRTAMRNLRRRYPAAGDLAFLPLDIIQGHRDEYGNPLTDACHDWTIGWAF